MNTNRVKIMLLLLGLLVEFVVGRPAISSEVETAHKWQKGSIVYLDINEIKKRSDLIIRAELIGINTAMFLDHAVRTWFGKFYRIVPEEVIKGQLPSNCVVGSTRVAYTLGSFPQMEEDIAYLLFLEEVTQLRSGENIPEELGVLYEPIDVWKGIIPLDKNARERRAIRRIEEQHGVKIDDMPDAFVEAIKASFVDIKADREKTEISDKAMAIFDALNLKMHSKKDAKAPK